MKTSLIDMLKKHLFEKNEPSDLSQHSSYRLTHNNFDMLRLIFAGMVCVVHAYKLSDFQQLKIFKDVLSSDMAVKAFFVVSGFLIFMSFERSSNIAAYAIKRIRRICPAYFAVVMLCAAGMVVLSSKSIEEYFSLGLVKYVVANLAFLNFLHPSLPGVFEANPKMDIINGSLWTLKIELIFYMAVPVFVFLFRKFGRIKILLLVYCTSVAYAVLMGMLAERTGSYLYVELGRQLPGQLSYFVAGAFCFYYLPLFERRIGYFLLISASVLAINIYYPLRIFEPFALATAVAFFGLFLYVGKFGKYGDFSYGVYILHFPVIQILLNQEWFQNKPWAFLIGVILITAASSIALWYLVEKKFLHRSSHYVHATSKTFFMQPKIETAPINEVE